jgi:hypothetical protein
MVAMVALSRINHAGLSGLLSFIGRSCWPADFGAPRERASIYFNPGHNFLFRPHKYLPTHLTRGLALCGNQAAVANFGVYPSLGFKALSQSKFVRRKPKIPLATFGAFCDGSVLLKTLRPIPVEAYPSNEGIHAEPPPAYSLAAVT